MIKQPALVCLLVVTSLVSSIAEAASHDRILHKIEKTSSFAVRGNVHPMAQAANDRGSVGRLFRMERMTMTFKPTDPQEADLNTLLKQQQDPASPNYHKWITPEEFADRFGISANDLTQIVDWLHAQGFTVDEVARNRRSVTFTGSAGQVETVFRTAIHEYAVDGKTFYANANDPYVPDAFANVVLGFRSLNNFHLKARARRTRVHDASPQFTSTVTGNHFLAPADFATIYNLNGLYANGLDGSGQRIAVMGQTNIDLTDIRAFRSASGMPPNDPEVVLVPGSSDPGTNNDDLGEADLDLEWSGAVARNAHLIYVNSNNGVFDSLQYAIDQNLAPVISISYGDCEKNFSGQDMNILGALGRQAVAQGITILSASGDTGAADCDYNARIASRGLAVDFPSSLPYVTGMGGSEFQDGAGSWSATNNATNGSALSYISEKTWNDNTASGTLSAGGGGRSIYFSKPDWQAGAGVPNDHARDVPDISLSASADHDGYLICSLGSCANGYRSTDGSLNIAGGTSVAAPAFAGIVAILNQAANSPQGNINPALYRLAGIAPGVFHDITAGGNQVSCRLGSTDCSSGGVIGYTAGPGYDQATGLGSVDASNLIASWSRVVAPAAQARPVVQALTPQSGGQGTTITALLTGANFSGVTNVTFSGAGITAGIQSGATATQIPLLITIAKDAAPGAQSVTVTTPAGSVTVDSVFTVQGASLPAGVTAAVPLPISAVEQGNTRSGYVIITPDANSPAPVSAATFGVVHNGIVQSQAGIVPAPMTGSSTMLVNVVPAIGRNLGVAVANPGDSGNTLTLTLEDANGNTVATTTMTVQPHQQVARFVTELFGSNTIGSAFSGSLHLQSPIAFSVLGLRFSGIEFSTLPAIGGNAGGSAAVVIPQFAIGGGWTSEIALINNSTTASTGRIDIFDSNGNPMSVPLNNATQSTFRYSIPAGGTFLLAPRDMNGQAPM